MGKEYPAKLASHRLWLGIILRARNAPQNIDAFAGDFMQVPPPP
ncbi:hypothetical protein NO2_1506, partial [Candidatus Termititenax persephonae]